MNILFISQYFFPENFKGNDLVFSLAKKGHKVWVITGKPNYPKGDFFEGYSFFKKNKEEINGVIITRLPIIPRKNGKIWLALNYISFYLSSYIFFLSRKRYIDFDIIFTQQLSPVTSSFPGMWFKNRYKKPLITWVLDLWPDSLIVNSNIKKGILINILDRLVRKLYLKSDVLLVSSLSFKKAIQTKIGEVIPIQYVPNWAEDIFSDSKSVQKNFGDLPTGFNIVFAGNIGEAQDLGNVLRAANKTKNNVDINWIFVGDGSYKNELLKIKEELDLVNVFYYSSHAIEYMPSLYSKADAMLLCLKGGSLVSQTVPAKLQTYMSSGKAILGMISGDANQIIKDSNCGFVCEAGDYEELAKNAIKISQLSFREIKEKEENSMLYYNKHFKRELVLNKMEQILSQAIDY